MLKKILTTSCLLIITLYIPLAFTIYGTLWYDVNIALNADNSITTVDATKLHLAGQNLTQFFSHRASLSPKIWSDKEIRHMSDVREIYNKLFILFLIAIATLATILTTSNSHRYTLLKSSAKKAAIAPLVFLLLIPFFNYFWTHIFHAALFDNKDWIITPADISYHLFPLTFFINSLFFIVTVSVLINIFLKNPLTNSKPFD